MKVGPALTTAVLQSTHTAVSDPTKEYPSAQPVNTAVEAAAVPEGTKLSVKVVGAVHLVLSYKVDGSVFTAGAVLSAPAQL